MLRPEGLGEDAMRLSGELKADIMANPDEFIDLDPELPQTLLDLKYAGKKLIVITNSEWFYTQAMMTYCFDCFLDGRGWRSLFDLVIVAARKPELNNTRWGLLLRTGNDKSHLARQIEKHADIYTSRVSNLGHSTPFVYFRSPRGSLPHDSGEVGGVE